MKHGIIKTLWCNLHLALSYSQNPRRHHISAESNSWSRPWLANSTISPWRLPNKINIIVRFYSKASCKLKPSLDLIYRDSWGNIRNKHEFQSMLFFSYCSSRSHVIESTVQLFSSARRTRTSAMLWRHVFAPNPHICKEKKINVMNKKLIRWVIGVTKELMLKRWWPQTKDNLRLG